MLDLDKEQKKNMTGQVDFEVQRLRISW